MVTGIIAVPARPLCSVNKLDLQSVRVSSMLPGAKDSASRAEWHQKRPRRHHGASLDNRQTCVTARVTWRYSHGMLRLFSIAARPNDRCCLTDASPWGAMHPSLTATTFTDSNNNIYLNASVCFLSLQRSGLVWPPAYSQLNTWMRRGLWPTFEKKKKKKMQDCAEMASIDEANAKLDDDQEGRWTVSVKKSMPWQCCQQSWETEERKNERNTRPNNNFHSIIKIKLNGTLCSPLVGYRHRNTPITFLLFHLSMRLHVTD